MDYKIIKADEVHGQIQVTYLYHGKDFATYALDVPIVDGAFITGDALDKMIKERAPLGLLERRKLAADATGFDEIHALVQAPAEPSKMPFSVLGEIKV